MDKCNLSAKDGIQILKFLWLHLRSDVSQNCALCVLVPFQNTLFTQAHFPPLTWQACAQSFSLSKKWSHYTLVGVYKIWLLFTTSVHINRKKKSTSHFCKHLSLCSCCHTPFPCSSDKGTKQLRESLFLEVEIKE